MSKIEWNEKHFDSLSQEEKDKYLDVILRQNRGKDKYLTNEQLSYRRKRETTLNSNGLSRKEKVSASSKGLEIDYN